MKRFVIIIALLIVTAPLSINGGALRPTIDFCKIYGAVYFEPNPRAYADFLVYVEDAESYADVTIFKQESRLDADRPGHWYVTEHRTMADYVIHLERKRAFANFTIYFTETESFAGCRR